MSAIRFTTLAALAAALLLVGCERPPMQSTQLGFRGTGMVEIDNPRIAAAQAAARPAVPADAPAAGADGPKAGQVYQNVKVLGDLPVAEFTRHMNAITQWVSPKEGCNYCHVANNFADDSVYTKVVARRMIQMTQKLNSDWKVHTGNTGVTCYTCHRGNPEPQQVWHRPQAAKQNTRPMMGNDFGQNKAMATVGYTSLPYDPFSTYLLGDEIRVAAVQPLPPGKRGEGVSLKDTEKTFGLMIHMSKSLGVNCTFCHNTQNFSHWSTKRVTSWHGIRMQRDLNNAFLVPLTASFPKDHLGPDGDVGKVYCATCHQGQNKPVGGQEMAKLYVGLQGAPAAAAAAPAMPPPVAEPTRSVLYFGVGSSELRADQAQGLVQLIDSLGKQPKATAFVSGFHSASGELAANQELAKKRAFAVRDALTAAGIAATRVKLDKPQQTEANLAGEDPSARRVDVKLQ